MATAPTASSDPSVIAKLLAGLNDTFSNPNNAGTIGFAQGLLQASAPHMLTPVSGGQALGMGAAASQDYQRAALANAMQRLVIPFQAMKVATFAQARQTLSDPKATPAQKAQAMALAANLISPGMGPAMISNSPAIQGPVTAAKQAVTPRPVGPGQRLVTGTGAQVVGAQGALPTGTTQGPAGTIAPLPGALPAIAGASGAQAGGAAAATFPFQSALKRTGIVQGPVSNRVLSLAPAATIAARQRQLGMMQGLTRAAQASGVPAPFSSMHPLVGQIQPPPSGGAVGPNPSAPGTPASARDIGATPAGRAHAAAVLQAATQGRPILGLPPTQRLQQQNGVVVPGMTPAQIAGTTLAQKQATQQLQTDIQSGQEAQQRVANLEELNTVAGKLQTGPGTDARIAVLKALASVPGVIGHSAGKLSAVIGHAQVFEKIALGLSLQTVSAAGQTAYNSYASVIHALPELGKTNMANSVVTASLLATARYQADKGNFAAKWQRGNNGLGFVPGKGSANGVWTQKAPFMTFFMNALPPAAQSMIVQKARTNLTLRAELIRARQGLQWLNSNGF